MKCFSLSSLGLAVLVYNPFVNAQQYAGEVIANSLPAVSGSELTYFKVADPSGDESANLTLINYMSLDSNGQRPDTSKIKRAVIIIHGLIRDPYLYEQNMLSAISKVEYDDINLDSVVLCAPYFPNGNDKNLGFPWTDGLSPGQGSTSSALVWSATDWANGGNNMYPHNTRTVSSYAALDQLVKYFDDTSIFPNMNQIVVAGHSLGAQMVNRYAAVGDVLSTNSPVLYYIANPDNYVWFDTERPYTTDTCPTYDVWRNGFTNYTDVVSYGDDIVSQGRPAVLARYNSRSIAYGRGLRDLGDLGGDCGPYTTGANRYERFMNFIKAFPPSCPDPFTPHGPCTTIDYVNTTHNAPVMFSSAAGLTRLFIDNFNGTGSRAADFFYPRQQAGDDPLPDLSQSS